METASVHEMPAANGGQPTGWNWGAFGLTWIWGLAHRTPISLLALVPVIGWIGMPVVLGLKGNQWAWQNRSWRDVEAFRRHQRSWAKAALVAWLGASITAVIAWKVAVTALTSSDAFQLARAELQADPTLSEVLGAPLVFGRPGGGASGTSELKFPISGPNAQGTAFVVAHQTLGAWQVDTAAIQLADGSRMQRVTGAPNFKWSLPVNLRPNVAPDSTAANPLPPRLPELPSIANSPSPEPTGVLPDASVRKVEARHHAEVRFCMAQEKLPPPAAPKVRAHFIVNPNGSVASVEVSERSNTSERTANCLAQAIRRWTFKEPKGGSARASLLLKR